MNQAADRRVRRTRLHLADALITLLEKKNINEISVRELSDLADINRGTFYLHYKDPYDLLQKMEQELLDLIQDLLRRHPAREIKDDPLVILSSLYRSIRQNDRLVQILLGKNGDIAFLAKLNQIIRINCIDNWAKVFNKKGTKTCEYFCSFIVAGSVSLVTEWLDNGMNESPEEMAILNRDFIRGGISVLT